MKYARIALLDACETVKPALAAKDLIEALTHIWFDGDTMTTYNDADLGIQVPFKTEFKGGLRGNLLLGLLANSKAKEVELTPTYNDHMQIVAARTKAKLAVLGMDLAVWDFPAPVMKNTFDIGEDFVRALKAVLVSVGNDTSIPEKLGVTMTADKAGVVLYTTDSKAVTQVRAATPKGKWMTKGDSVIMPTAFCEQVLRVCAAGGFMEVRKDCVIAGNGDGVLVYARLVDVHKPLDFAGTFAAHSKAKDKFDIPTKLEGALDRAIVLLDGMAIGEPVTLLAFQDKLRVETHAEGRGNMKDFMDVPGINEIELKVDPQLLKRALPYATEMVLTDQAVVFYGPDAFVYLASTGGA